MNFSMSVQEKGDPLIQVTSWAGLTIKRPLYIESIINLRTKLSHYENIFWED